MIVFLITSIINPKVCNLVPIDERFEQTLQTIASIRKQIKDVHCVIIEFSQLTKQQHSIISKKVDKLIDLSNDQVSQFHCNNKSTGDAFSTLKGIEYCETLSNVDAVFKISGRYLLNENFNLKLIKESDKDFYFCKVINESASCYVTMLYGFKNIKLTKEILDRAIQMIWNSNQDIETTLYNIIRDKSCLLMDKIGVEGMCAADRVWHIR